MSALCEKLIVVHTVSLVFTRQSIKEAATCFSQTLDNMESTEIRDHTFCKVNYLRPSQKRPKLLRIQNVCFIPVKFPESPATGYGELMLKNLNGG